MTTPNKTPPGADPKQLERTGTVREIGSQAVWSLSSCKPGFGVDQLRDDNLETYWQSDGSQPHLVNIQFRRKTTVKTLCIYADYKSDESYTPSKISVRVGNNFHNLQEIRVEISETLGRKGFDPRYVWLNRPKRACWNSAAFLLSELLQRLLKGNDVVRIGVQSTFV
ncbi:anaphase-promoting complex subunit 10 isoform X3 [Bos indicus x Bos taurus]|nr:anaphase-promoting complex subunit 10 isoform X3 [Bos indicus x Bos taurus]